MIPLEILLNTNDKTFANITFLEFWNLLINNEIQQDNFTELDFRNLKLLFHPRFKEKYKIRDKYYIYKLLKITESVIFNDFYLLNVNKSLELLPLLSENEKQIQNKNFIDNPYHELDRLYCNNDMFEIARIMYIKIDFKVVDYVNNDIDLFEYNIRPKHWVLKIPNETMKLSLMNAMKLSFSRFIVMLLNIKYEWNYGMPMSERELEHTYETVAKNIFQIKVDPNIITKYKTIFIKGNSTSFISNGQIYYGVIEKITKNKVYVKTDYEKYVIYK